MKNVQRGGMSVLMAGFMLPLMILLCSAAIDVNGYTARVEEIQNIADDATLYGARFLPDLISAKAAISTFLQNRYPGASFTLSVIEDVLQVQVNGVFEPFFAPFFNHVLNSPIQIPYTASSRARAAPLDVFIAVDRGADLSPDFSATDSDAWGSPGEWGAAEIFSNQLSVGMSPRIATQQCFNPLASMIKKTAIRAFDFFSSFHMNRVGVGSFPGAISPYGITRDINEGINKTEKVYFYDTHPDSDSGTPVVVEEKEGAPLFPVQSVYCAAIAESEPFFSGYLLPSTPSYSGVEQSSEPLIDQASWEVNLAHDISIREKIWSRSVSKVSRMDFSLVVAAMEQTLFSVGSHALRGNLVNSAPQSVFVITSRLPEISGTQFGSSTDSVAQEIHTLFEKVRSIKAKQSTKLSLYYVMIGGSAQDASALNDFFTEETLTAPDGAVLFEPKVIRGEDPDLFLSRVLTATMMEQRRHAVSK